MSKYVIIHGQLRELTDEELMHWKYIKKEKKNGRWVYYYDDNAAKLVLDLQKESVNKAKSNEIDKAIAYHDAKEKLDNNTITLGSGARMVNVLDLYDEETAKKNYKNAIAKAKKAVRRYETMRVEYVINKVSSTTISKVANFFSKAFGKKK